MLKLTITGHNGVLESETEHATLTEALNEYAGWKDETLRYRIDGKVSAECACKRVMESRNRVLYLALSCNYWDSEQATATNPEGVSGSIPTPIELKAPQICKLLSSMLQPATMVHMTVTNDDMQIA